MQFFNQTKDTILELLNTDEKKGLTQNTANVLKEKYGSNKLKEKKTNVQRFFESFKDVRDEEFMQTLKK